MNAKPVHIVVNYDSPPPRRHEHQHCWAWLLDGRQACGICGTPRRR